MEWGEVWKGLILLRVKVLAATFAHTQFAPFWTNEEIHFCDVNSTVLFRRKHDGVLLISIYLKQ